MRIAATALGDPRAHGGVELELEGRIVTEDGIVAGRLKCDRRVLAIEPADVSVDAPWILPGFIDLHVHGGHGGDVMAGEEAIRTACRFHASHGTTALLATTVTAPVEEIEAALLGIAAVQRAPAPGEALVLGAHLEGPFINPERLGAQPPFARVPERWLVDRLLSLASVRVVTMAPEIDGAASLLERLVEADVRVQLGHTAATCEQAVAALDDGAAGVTHLFNVMGAFHHREPGTVGAALAYAEYAEVIADRLHVAPDALRMALRTVPRLYCVTDAVAAAGMPDGEYALGSHRVHKRGNAVWLDEETLAGSTLTMDAALRNLVGLGLEIEDAARRVSTFPADYLGLTDRGRLRVGARADLAVLGADLQVLRVLVDGTELGPADAGPTIG